MKFMKKMFLLLILSTSFLGFTIPTTSAKYARDVEIGTVNVVVESQK